MAPPCNIGPALITGLPQTAASVLHRGCALSHFAKVKLICQEIFLVKEFELAQASSDL